MLSMMVFAAATASAPPRLFALRPDVAKTVAPICKTTGPELVGSKPDAPVSAQKLNELPNADEYLTVMRIDQNGCQKPAIVAYDIGSAPRKQR